MRFLVMCLVLVGLLPGVAAAERRVALVVGNSAYESAAPLANAGRDAQLMADVLAAQGFEVTLLLDGGRDDLVRAISTFGRSLRDNGPDTTGLFYFAGHGVQSYGTNFLVPVDAAISDAADLDLVGVPAESILRQMSSADNRANIVILDACRNNPFAGVPDMNDNGLAEMKAPTGTFLAYSTAPGMVAVDGVDGHSPFTGALARLMTTPGLPIEELFRAVRVEVLNVTRGLQTPWDTSSLTTEFFFVPPAVVSPEEKAEAELWASVKETRDPVMIMFFLTQYPDSAVRDEAKALLDEVMGGTTILDPEPPVAEPSPREQEMLEAARRSGNVVDYTAYLTTFPNGAFAELARTELRALLIVNPPIVDGPPEPPAEDPLAGFAFDTPFPEGEGIKGMSLSQILATGTPLYPPIEGIPETMWKGQNCSNCHQWTRPALCDQAKMYLREDAESSLDKPHPLGLQFKLGLRAWAAGECP